MNMMKYDELMEMYTENVELLDDMKKVVEEIDNLLYSLDDLWCEYIYFVDKTHILSQIAELEKERAELDNFKDSNLEWLEAHIDDDKIVALGEIGLDYHYDNANREKEIIVLRYGLFDSEALTQKEVADLLGISQSYISRLEKRIIDKMRQEILGKVKVS